MFDDRNRIYNIQLFLIYLDNETIINYLKHKLFYLILTPLTWKFGKVSQ